MTHSSIDRLTQKIRQKGSMRFKLAESWVLFFACFIIYRFNQQFLTSGDTVPNSLLAFNWLFNHSLNFDIFRDSHFYKDGQIPYFFVESRTGHLTSFYPIGVAIITLPLYLCFYFALLIFQGHAIDLASSDFETKRLFFEKLSAIVVASLSVVIFYQASKLKFGKAIALLSTAIYAFATNTWVVSSQALWQHGATNLVLLGILLGLFKANRTQGFWRKLLLLSVGILSGFLLGVRPTNLIFLIAILIYGVFAYRSKSLFLFLGLSSFIPVLAWNLYYFGNFTGGYNLLANPFIFTPEQFTTGFFGILLSLSRGLFVYTPILLVSIFGFIEIAKQWRYSDEKLILCLIPGCIILSLQYCFFRIWWGGHSYGARFLTDLLPVLCFAINYAIARYLGERSQKNTYRSFQSLTFTALLLVSIFVQIVGAFGSHNWNSIPVNIDFETNSIFSKSRVWQWQDSQIERDARSILVRIAQPARQNNYRQGLAGKILELQNDRFQPLPSKLIAKPGTEAIFRAQLQNLGTSQWLGYQTGAIDNGEMRIKIQLLSLDNTFNKEDWLFISGQPKHQEITEALGTLKFPNKPGKYKLRATLCFLLNKEQIEIPETKDGKTISKIERQIVVQ